jgi:NADH-quinone oxidoreductase subunit E
MLADKFPTEIASILAKYPPDQKRSAVMPLLYLAQSEYGYITPATMVEVGNLIDLSSTEVAGIVGFYTLFSDASFGKRRMQICTDLPCALRGAEAFAAAVCQKAGVKPGEITKDGEFSVETVMCLAGCDHAPMFQVQDANGIHYHESPSIDQPLTAEQALTIMDDYKRAGMSS